MAQPFRNSSWPAVPPASRALGAAPAVKANRNRAILSKIATRGRARIVRSPAPLVTLPRVRKQSAEPWEDRELFVRSLQNLFSRKCNE